MSLTTHHWTTAAATAKGIKKELDRTGGGGDPWSILAHAIRHLRVALQAENPTTPDRSALDWCNTAPTGAVRQFLREVPASTDDERWDTLLLGQIGRELRLRGVERPAWCRPRPLDEDWYPRGRTTDVHQLTSTDLWYLRIFVDEAAFDAPAAVIDQSRLEVD
jgi:hypothetical protein